MNKPPRKLVEGAPRGTIWFGGPADKCKLTLRIYGEDMVPAEVSKALGRRPTESWQKGDTLPSGHVRPKSGWLLTTPESKKGDLDVHVAWMFSRLTTDVRVWKKLGAKYEMYLSSYVEMERWNGGLVVSAASLTEIGRRGLSLQFDIYSNMKGKSARRAFAGIRRAIQHAR